MNVKTIVSLCIALLIVIPLYAQPDVPGLPVISRHNLMKSVTFLASPKLQGRLSGSEGYNTAARFVADEFAQLGLKPLGDSAYFQKLNVEYNEIYPPLRLNLVEAAKIKKEYKPGKQFVCRELTGAGHVTAPVVFCGYGLSQPEIGYDDYAGVDVKGKIVIAFKPNPRWKINDSANWASNYPRAKAKTAKAQGAVALMIVSQPNDPNAQGAIISVLEGGGEADEHFPQIHIDIPVADDFLAGTGYTLKTIQAKIDSTKKPFSLSLSSEAEIEIHAAYSKEKPTMNVIGLLEGSDPVLKNEYLVIGGHLDHVGGQANEIYAPGANDNASGSAAVIEIARAFVKGNVRPKRSVVFTTFASEELGLVGARYFVDHSPVPLEKIAAMINLDCIGFGDSMQVGNGKSAPMLWQIARRADSLYTQRMVNATWNGGGADAGPFHDKGIPASYFVTTNSYAHLHDITDTPETLNQLLFETIVKLAYLTAYEVAQGNYVREVVIK